MSLKRVLIVSSVVAVSMLAWSCGRDGDDDGAGGNSTEQAATATVVAGTPVAVIDPCTTRQSLDGPALTKGEAAAIGPALWQFCLGSAGAGSGDRNRRGLRHLAPFGVHAVICGVLDLHRSKGTGAHVQCDVTALDAGFLQAREQLLSQMQRGRRRRDRTVAAGEHRLIVCRVMDVAPPWPPDIRR